MVSAPRIPSSRVYLPHTPSAPLDIDTEAISVVTLPGTPHSVVIAPVTPTAAIPLGVLPRRMWELFFVADGQLFAATTVRTTSLFGAEASLSVEAKPSEVLSQFSAEGLLNVGVAISRLVGLEAPTVLEILSNPIGPLTGGAESSLTIPSAVVTSAPLTATGMLKLVHHKKVDYTGSADGSLSLSRTDFKIIPQMHYAEMPKEVTLPIGAKTAQFLGLSGGGGGREGDGSVARTGNGGLAGEWVKSPVFVIGEGPTSTHIAPGTTLYLSPGAGGKAGAKGAGNVVESSRGGWTFFGTEDGTLIQVNGGAGGTGTNGNPGGSPGNNSLGGQTMLGGGQAASGSSRENGKFPGGGGGGGAGGIFNGQTAGMPGAAGAGWLFIT